MNIDPKTFPAPPTHSVNKALSTEGIGYDVQLEHDVHIPESVGVPYRFVEWCSENCKHRWGWYFGDNLEPIMSFEDEKERFAFSLSNGIKETDKR